MNPRPLTGYLAIVMLALCAVPVPQSKADNLSANEIIAKSDSLDKLPSWGGQLTIRMFEKGSAEQVRQAKVFNKQNGKGAGMMRLIRFTSPPDISGTSVLIHEHSHAHDDIWIYLPSLEKVRRLIANDQKDSFVGTDFSYADILTPKERDYNYTLEGQDRIDNVNCYKIVAAPKTASIEDATGDSRYVSWIRTDSFLRIQARYYDRSGRPYKLMRVDSEEPVNGYPGKWLITKVEMTNLQSGHSTIMTFSDIAVGKAYDDLFFAPSRLSRWQ